MPRPMRPGSATGSVCVATRWSACRPRPSGICCAGEYRHRILGGRDFPIAARRSAVVVTELFRSAAARRGQTLGACRTCWATYSSGRKTGTPLTKRRMLLIRSGRRPEGSGCCAAGRGSTVRGLPRRLRNGLPPDVRSVNIGFRVCRGSPIEPLATAPLDAGPLQR